MQQKSFGRTLMEILGIVLAVGAAGAFLLTMYTFSALRWARNNGVYETPQQGTIARANMYYCDVEKVDIEHASTNSFDGSNPHIWYVIYRVYAKNHIPCDAENPGVAMYHGTYENAGNFWLNVKQGWVFMPEGKFPGVIGTWMKVLGLAGEGDPYHIPREG